MKFLSTATTLACVLSATTAQTWWKPTAGATWNIELSKVPTASQANDQSYEVWDFDLFDSGAPTVKMFKNTGHQVICYFSAGSWENWRADANDFPASALGNPLDGWPGEKWLDTRSPAVRAIMQKRIALAAQNGCDAVDPDNVDGYENNPGFPLTKADAVNYVQFLVQAAHDAGLACSLKNGGDFLSEVVDVADFSVNEQCVQFNECNLYQPFIRQNKPVFHVEYTAKNLAPASFVKKSCQNTNAMGFSTLVKHLSLNAWTTTCPVGS